jgi:hypothetical protein
VECWKQYPNALCGLKIDEAAAGLPPLALKVWRLGTVLLPAPFDCGADQMPQIRTVSGPTGQNLRIAVAGRSTDSARYKDKARTGASDPFHEQTN